MPRTISLKTVDLDATGAAAAWNALFPFNTEVRYLHPSLMKRCLGFTREPARLREDGVPVVLVTGHADPLRLTDLEVVKERPVDPCMVCRHPRESHGIRYAALQGDHEWIDPYDRSVRPAEPRTAPDPVVDPYEPQPDREDRAAWAGNARNEQPAGLFAHIAAAAARKAA